MIAGQIMNRLSILTLATAVVIDISIAARMGAQEVTFPYKARVKTEGAVVHSGPGKVHYPTDRLDRDAEVEVYRHDPGGWRAIRPPEGSFSLVRSNALKFFPEGLAEVTEADARAWVGTRLSPVDQPMWQVQLKKGELLDVLGTVDRNQYQLDDEQPDWVQIEPPSGEFRWIHGDHLAVVRSVSNEADQGNQITIDAPVSESWADPTPQSNLANSVDAPDRTQNATLEIESAVARGGPNGWRPASKSINTFVSQGSRFTAENLSSRNQNFDWGTTSEVQSQLMPVRSPIFDEARTAGDVTASSTSVPTTPTSGINAPEIQTLELRLTNEMLKPPANWNLADIALQAQRVKQFGVNSEVVGLADRLLAKLKRCGEIQASYRAADANHQPETHRFGTAISSGQESEEFQSSESTGERQRSELFSHYDAHGWLNELVRDGGLGQTTYVLQDADGKITHHVAAPPGLNLRRYLNREVGIIGNRGFHQQLNLDHVTAERVVEIDKILR